MVKTPTSIFRSYGTGLDKLLKVLCINQITGKDISFNAVGQPIVSFNFAMKHDGLGATYVMPHRPDMVEFVYALTGNIFWQNAESSLYTVAIPECCVVSIAKFWLDESGVRTRQDMIDKMADVMTDIETDLSTVITDDNIVDVMAESVRRDNRHIDVCIPPDRVNVIDMLDILDRDRCKALVSRLLKMPLPREDLFDDQHARWCRANHWLLEMIKHDIAGDSQWSHIHITGSLPDSPQCRSIVQSPPGALGALLKMLSLSQTINVYQPFMLDKHGYAVVSEKMRLHHHKQHCLGSQPIATRNVDHVDIIHDINEQLISLYPGTMWYAIIVPDPCIPVILGNLMDLKEWPSYEQWKSNRDSYHDMIRYEYSRLPADTTDTKAALIDSVMADTTRFRDLISRGIVKGIDFTDLFDRDKCACIVEDLTGMPLKNRELFFHYHLKWKTANSEFLNKLASVAPTEISQCDTSAASGISHNIKATLVNAGLLR